MRCVWSVSSGCSSSSRWMRSPSVDFVGRERAQDAQGHGQNARLLLMRRRVLQVQHFAECRRRQIGEQLLFVIGQFADAVGQQRDRDRPARSRGRAYRPRRRWRRRASRVRRLRSARSFDVGAPDVRIGVAREVAFAVDQDGRNAAQQQLFDERQCQRRLARTRAAEECGVAFQNALVQRHGPRPVADFAARENARAISAVLIENDRQAAIRRRSPAGWRSCRHPRHRYLASALASSRPASEPCGSSISFCTRRGTGRPRRSRRRR